MKAKVKIILDLDNQKIISMDLNDATLNALMLTPELELSIHKKIGNLPVRRFTFTPNVSQNPIGQPYLVVETTLELFPNVYSNPNSKIGYGCILHSEPRVCPIPYEKYKDKRRKFLLDSALKITESQNKAGTFD